MSRRALPLGCLQVRSVQGQLRPRPQARLKASAIRHFSSTAWLRAPYTEHVQVPCASSGHVTVSLHDIARHSVLSPLVVNLPAFPVQDINAIDTYLPRFLHRYPTATIHYRWPQRDRRTTPSTTDHEDPEAPPAPSSSSSTDTTDTPPQPPAPLPQWPTPIHDTLAAYDFLLRTLTPPPTGENGHSHHQRRAIYLYGRHLGGTLAASLGLTESHEHAPMAVRGLLAVNGVYNWTTFLPDHPVNTTRLTLQRELREFGVPYGNWGEDADGDGDIAMMKWLMPRLFAYPGHLFDPFASPVLFFHTAGLMIPPSFRERWRPDYWTDKLVITPSSSALSPGSGSGTGTIDPYDYVYSDPEDPPPPTPFTDPDSDTGLAATNSDSDADADLSPAFMAPPARKGYLAFPPRASTLKIPTTLLIHSAPPPPLLLPNALPKGIRRPSAWRVKIRNAENSFASQALGLAGLMRRSVDKLETKERMRWDEELQDPDGEAGRRVETGEVAVGRDGFEDVREGEEMARQWFEDHLG